MCFTVQLSRFLFIRSQIKTGAEKVGFEPTRRYQRPTPFPGEPLRPAWVLLQIALLTKKSCSLQELLYYTATASPCQATFLLFLRFAYYLRLLHRQPGCPEGKVQSYADFPSAYLSGESGIRTHAPFRTNGFQDRLVMTTSISLLMCLQSCFIRLSQGRSTFSILSLIQ